MATIKSHTDINQSKVLATILPLESADMCYSNDGTAIKIDANPYTVRYSMWKDCVVEIIPCWSLAALLGVLPEGTRLLKSTNISSIGDTKYHCDCPKGNIDVWLDNPIDACVAMIEKLNELNLL